MNNDPVGSNGRPADEPPRETDFGLAVTGGSSFMKRLQQLGAAADRIDQATAQFQFGKDIKAKMAETRDRLESAKQKEADAAKVLADAVESAKAKEAQADKVLADARAVKAEANKVKADADKIKADAEKLRERHERKLADVQAKEQQAIDAAEVSRGATAKAEARQKELAAKIDRLQQELRAISVDAESR
jgi:hypothetical protein